MILAGDRSSSPASTAPMPTSTIPCGHILVVEDDPMIREALATALRRSAYQVSCAEDGEEGWDAVRAEHFDALITDHEMPRLTGLGLIRRVRALPLQIPVILTSGRIPLHEPDLPRLLSPGAAFAKPYSFGALLEKLGSIIGRPDLTVSR